MRCLQSFAFACKGVSRASTRSAFTLVEMLIVMLIFLILTGVALPTVRGLVNDQKTTTAARNFAAYVDEIRSRAIAEGRSAGILIERLAPNDGMTVSNNVFGAAAALRVRQVRGVPAYVGDGSDVRATLLPPLMATPYLLRVRFEPTDNQLLTLSASLVGQPNEASAPIRSGDLLELPGGLRLPLTLQYRAITAPASTKVFATVDVSGLTGGSQEFPSAAASALLSIPPAPVGRNVKFKIYRRPVVSSSSNFTFPRGVAIDLNYSGFGGNGNEFAAEVSQITPTLGVGDAFNIAVLFGADGKVESVSDTSGQMVAPTGLIFFCLGRVDRITPDDLFAVDKQALTANIMDSETTWLVINPLTGRVASTPSATISTTIPTTNDHNDPNPDAVTFPNAMMRQAELDLIDSVLRESRQFALLSDTVDE